MTERVLTLLDQSSDPPPDDDRLPPPAGWPAPPDRAVYHELPGEIVDRAHRQYNTSSRTDSVRIYVLDYFRSAASEGGHKKAGHGALRRS